MHLHFDKQRKNELVAYIDILFNQNIDETSYISAKFEAIKHFRAVYLLTANERQRHHDVTAFQADCSRAMIYFDATDIAWLDVIIEM